MIPEKTQGKVLGGTVVAVGKGYPTEQGDIIPSQVKVGDQVLLPENGGLKVTVDEKVYYVLRESDIEKFE